VYALGTRLRACFPTQEIQPWRSFAPYVTSALPSYAINNGNVFDRQ